MFHAVVCEDGVVTYSTDQAEAERRLAGHRFFHPDHSPRLEALDYRPRVSGILAQWDHPDAVPYRGMS